jgi:hypothetical protein
MVLIQNAVGRPGYHDLTSAASRNVDTLTQIHNKDAQIIEDMERALSSWSVYAGAAHDGSAGDTGGASSRFSETEYDRRGGIMADEQDGIGYKAAEIALASRFSVADCLALKRKIRRDKKIPAVPTAELGPGPTGQPTLQTVSALPLPVESTPDSCRQEPASVPQEEDKAAISPRSFSCFQKERDNPDNLKRVPETTPTSSVSVFVSPGRDYNTATVTTADTASKVPRTLPGSPVVKRERPYSAPSSSSKAQTCSELCLPDINCKVLVDTCIDRADTSKPSLFGSSTNNGSNVSISNVKKFNELRRNRRMHHQNAASANSTPRSVEYKHPDTDADFTPNTNSQFKQSPRGSGELSGAQQVSRQIHFGVDGEENVGSFPRQSTGALQYQLAVSPAVGAPDELNHLQSLELDLLRRQKKILEKQEQMEHDSSLLGQSSVLYDIDGLPKIYDKQHLGWEKTKQLHSLALKKHLEQQAEQQQRIERQAQRIITSPAIDENIYKQYIESQRQLSKPVRSKSASLLGRYNGGRPADHNYDADDRCGTLAGGPLPKLQMTRHVTNMDHDRPAMTLESKDNGWASYNSADTNTGEVKNKKKGGRIKTFGTVEQTSSFGMENDARTNDFSCASHTTGNPDTVDKDSWVGNKSKTVKSSTALSKGASKGKKLSKRHRREQEHIELLRSVDSSEDNEAWFQRVINENKTFKRLQKRSALLGAEDPVRANVSRQNNGFAATIADEDCHEDVPRGELAARNAGSASFEKDEDSFFLSDTDSNCNSTNSSPERTKLLGESNSFTDAVVGCERPVISPHLSDSARSRDQFDSARSRVLGVESNWTAVESASAATTSELSSSSSLCAARVATLTATEAGPAPSSVASIEPATDPATLQPKQIFGFFDRSSSSDVKGRHNVCEVK